MHGRRLDMEGAIEVFVRGHSAGKSRTFPYEAARVGPLWVMRDAPRKNARGYRKEEWISYRVDAREVDTIARRHTRGRFFVCAMVAEGEPEAQARAAYKALGYRLLATEGFFVHRLQRIPRRQAPATIERVQTAELAALLGKATRTRPIATELLSDDAPFRQYVALEGTDIVGRVQKRGCRRGDMVRRHACQPLAPAPGHRPGAALPYAAGRPGPGFGIIGTDGQPHRRAALPARGLRTHRNAVDVRAGQAGTDLVSRFRSSPVLEARLRSELRNYKGH